jgi:hypothetical protein
MNSLNHFLILKLIADRCTNNKCQILYLFDDYDCLYNLALFIYMMINNLISTKYEILKYNKY